MDMVSVFAPRFYEPSQRGVALGITNYLNQAVALHPPLCIEAYLPLLKIYLPAEYACTIAWVLQQIESTLTTLRGPKYWDVYVYLGHDASGAPHLIHHTLLEPTSVRPTSAIALAEMSASTVFPISPLIASFQYLGTTSDRQSPIPQTQKANWRKPSPLQMLAIGVSSFIIGGGMALSGNYWRSRLSWIESIPSLTPPELTPLLTLSPSRLGGSSTNPSSLTLPDGATEVPDPLAKGLEQPITSANSLSATADVLTVPLSIQPAITIKAVGDIIPGTNFPDYRIPDPSYLFNSVKMFMGEVDLLFGNFESTLTGYPYSAKDISRGMTFAFRTPPEFAKVLREAGFDVLSVANNHSFDFGDAGFDDTIAHIEQAGMRAVGRKDEIVILEVNHHEIAFIGFSYWNDHNNMNDLAAAADLVKKANEQADIVVISVHAGAEGTSALRVRDQTEYFFSENRGNMVQFSRAMVDAGADLILGHGPHVPRAVELYQNKLIAYSLGNFLGYRSLSTVGPLGQSLILQVDLNSKGEFLKGRVIPVALDPNGVPYMDDFFCSVTLVRQLTVQDFPATPLVIDQMGYILKTD